MQKNFFSGLVILLAGTYALSASADTKGISSGSTTPSSPPPMSQQQFKSEIDKAVKNNAEDLNNRVQQIQKSGPGVLVQPEPVTDPNTVQDQNTAPSQIKPNATPAAPVTIKPAAPKDLPPAPAQPDSSSTNASPAPYTGYGTGTGKANDANGGNNNNSKSNSWNMGY